MALKMGSYVLPWIFSANGHLEHSDKTLVFSLDDIVKNLTESVGRVVALTGYFLPSPLPPLLLQLVCETRSFLGFNLYSCFFCWHYIISKSSFVHGTTSSTTLSRYLARRYQQPSSLVYTFPVSTFPCSRVFRIRVQGNLAFDNSNALEWSFWVDS